MKGRDDATNTGPDGRTVLPRKEGGRTYAEVKAESPPSENHGPRQKPQKTRGKSKTSHQAPINLGVGWEKEREEREEYGDIRAEVSAKNSNASSTGR